MVGGKRWLGVCAGAFVVGVTPLSDPDPRVRVDTIGHARIMHACKYVPDVEVDGTHVKYIRTFIHVHISCIPTLICVTPQPLLYSEPPMLA